MITTFKKNPRLRYWVGKKTLANMKANARLKKKFAALGITSCELRYINCTGNNFLSWAHGKRRRFLIGDELETLCCLACVPCHQKLDRLPHEATLAIVLSVIAERERRVSSLSISP